MERPKCEIPDCERPATEMVGLLHDFRYRLTCRNHKSHWYDKGGFGCWFAKLEGYIEDKSIEEHFRDNQARAATRGE